MAAATTESATELPVPTDGTAVWRAYGDNVATSPFYVILFYKYVDIPDAVVEAKLQRAQCDDLGLSGRLLIATEGINGTLCGSPKSIEAYVAWMRAREDVPFHDVDWKGSCAAQACFSDLHCRVVREIISTGGAVAPPHRAGAEPEGEELPPEEFHARLQEALASGKDDWVLLDCRNENESAVGKFQGALRVPMRTFAEFPKWSRDHAAELSGKRVMMYCTGGIRCRKGSAIVKKMADPADVVQLRGGIHRYLESFADGGLWQGRNFVFDKRQSLAPPAVDRPLPTATGDEAAVSAVAAATADDEEDEEAATADDASSSSSSSSSSSDAVFGRCHHCDRPWETFCGRDVCQVCRFLLLVCPDCRARSRGLLFCRDHAHLGSCYRFWLDDSTAEELRAQAEGLEEAAEALEGGRRMKNRRRTLRRQLERVRARLAAVEAGEEEPVPKPARVPCRTCSEAECEGDCWGFWVSDVEARRKRGELRARDELYVQEEAKSDQEA